MNLAQGDTMRGPSASTLCPETLLHKTVSIAMLDSHRCSEESKCLWVVCIDSCPALYPVGEQQVKSTKLTCIRAYHCWAP